jgi:hypothetical protein
MRAPRGELAAFELRQQPPLNVTLRRKTKTLPAARA